MSDTGYSRVIAIDYGKKIVGFAFGTVDTRVASGAGACAESEAIQHAQSLVDDNRADLVIVGLPRSQSGSETQQSDITRLWAKELQAALSVDVQLVDEFATTKLATDILVEQGVDLNVAKQNGTLDEASAMIILDGYFEEIN